MNLDRSHGLLGLDSSLLRWKEQYLHSTIAGTKCGIIRSQALRLRWYYTNISKCSHARGRFFGPPGTTWRIPEWRWLYKANSLCPKSSSRCIVSSALTPVISELAEKIERIWGCGDGGVSDVSQRSTARILMTPNYTQYMQLALGISVHPNLFSVV